MFVDGKLGEFWDPTEIHPDDGTEFRFNDIKMGMNQQIANKSNVNNQKKKNKHCKSKIE